MKSIFLALFFAALAPIQAFALPTQSAKSLSWEYPQNTSISGFYLYFAPQSEAAPRNYLGTSKIKIGPEKRSVVLLSVSPSSSGELCFKMSAFQMDLTRTERESEFTEEACGDFGLLPVSHFLID